MTDIRSLEQPLFDDLPSSNSSSLLSGGKLSNFCPVISLRTKRGGVAARRYSIDRRGQSHQSLCHKRYAAHQEWH
jgi:hypothetical protein